MKICLSTHIYLFSFFYIRIFKFYSVRRFQFYNTVLSIMVTIRSSSLIPLITESLFPVAPHPPLAPRGQCSNIILKMASIQFFQVQIFVLIINVIFPIRILKCTGRPRFRCAHGGSDSRYK